MVRLFSEISPTTRALAVRYHQAKRGLRNRADSTSLARQRERDLPVVVYRHRSLIRRRLGDVDMALQENKAHNLALVAPRVSGAVLTPGEIFSFWALAGPVSERRGYRAGLTISSGRAEAGIGGGLCQFTNLIHWLALHSPLDVVEHHHHDQVDLFPDFGRQVPFGCGTSIMYNYRDYRLRNGTDRTFSFTFAVSDTHLLGTLRCDRPLEQSFHMKEEAAYFEREGTELYRCNRVVRRVVDKATGREDERRIVRTSRARVMYDHAFVDPDRIITRGAHEPSPDPSASAEA